MNYRLGSWSVVAAICALLALSRAAHATPGTHAPAVSTYDTRASSIVFSYRHGSSDAGSFNTFSYNANFTSTTGRLSAQFGIHYVNFDQAAEDATAHGIAGSGVAVLEYPIAGRYDNGVPKAAIAIHLGGVPTAYISGERNFLTVPLVLGLGVPLSPAQVVTITPWFELGVSADLDTVVKPENVTIDSSDVTVDLTTGTASLRPGAVEDALDEGLKIDFGVSVPMRAGLDAALHLGSAADLNVYGMLSTLGGGFSGDLVKTLGASLLIRWDDIVPAVLPKPVNEDSSCEATERRFRGCPASRKWLAPEQQSSPLPGPNEIGGAGAAERLPAATPAPALPQPPNSEGAPAPAGGANDAAESPARATFPVP